jgi:antitoxin component of MazEF toxin-antitoxin module
MLTVKSSKKDLITFPENLLDELGLKDGEQIDIKLKKGAIVVIKETEDFFALEGALKDIDIEKPINDINKDWKRWKPLKSL